MDYTDQFNLLVDEKIEAKDFKYLNTLRKEIERVNDTHATHEAFIYQMAYIDKQLKKYVTNL